MPQLDGPQGSGNGLVPGGGVIIALDDDKRIRRALQIAQGIDFYRYEVKFSLIPAS